MNKIIQLFVALLFITPGFSQGLVENELTSNAILIQKATELRSAGTFRAAGDTLTLGSQGIQDDFSYKGPYPDTMIWMDDKVYINTTFPKSPPTVGVATFDGLDYNGLPYDWSAGSGSSAVADYLTSKPIDLAAFAPTDSIRLSFYYQPQGIGNAPEPNDSLVLQFKKASGWVTVWSLEGYTLTAGDSSWGRVMIPVTDTSFLWSGFQFRFYNRATISGNTDHWSIDYVYLNQLRPWNDTVEDDITFVYNNCPIINTYSEMPWRQYDTTYMKVIYNTVGRNLSNYAKNTSYFSKLYDLSGAQVGTTHVGSATSIWPGIDTIPSHRNDSIKYVIPATMASPDRYTMVCYMNATPDNERRNDTIRYEQTFGNYFAYDDGTAENSFGMSMLSAQLAVQFKLNVPDSLRYIDIYWNPFTTNASVYAFDLMVWADLGGVPGPTLYTSGTPQNPVYSGVKHNQFVRYTLDAPISMSAGIFYVGFLQHTTQFLNIGVDKNFNNQSKVFYNVTGLWNNAPYTGSVMIRPVFGSAYEFSGTPEIVKEDNIILYPNPSADDLYIHYKKGVAPEFRYSIVDMLGRTVVPETEYSDKIDVSALRGGIYFVNVRDEKGVHALKFIKTQ